MDGPAILAKSGDPKDVKRLCRTVTPKFASGCWSAAGLLLLVCWPADATTAATATAAAGMTTPAYSSSFGVQKPSRACLPTFRPPLSFSNGKIAKPLIICRNLPRPRDLPLTWLWQTHRQLPYILDLDASAASSLQTCAEVLHDRSPESLKGCVSLCAVS